MQMMVVRSHRAKDNYNHRPCTERGPCIHDTV